MTDKIQTTNNLKVAIIGPHMSGKTTFIKSISETEVISTFRMPSYKENPYQIAYDFGRIAIDDSDKLFLFGSPGARRFDFELRDEISLVFIERFLGFIIMVDSTKPETFREAKHLVEKVQNSPLYNKFVIAANKPDYLDAWDIEALRIVLRIPDEIPVIPCIATDKQSVANVLIALCEEVLKLWDDD